MNQVSKNLMSNKVSNRKIFRNYNAVHEFITALLDTNEVAGLSLW